MLELIIITFLCGVVGIGAGGLAGVLIGSSSKRFDAIMLSFTAGIMLSLVCFELIEEAADSGVSVLLIAGIILVSAAAICVLDYIVDKKSGHSHDFITCADCDEEFVHDAGHAHCAHDDEEHGLSMSLHSPHAEHYEHQSVKMSYHAHTHEEAVHEEHGSKNTKHTEENPEIHHHKRTSGLQLMLAGATMAVGVAVHNLPEGMSIGTVYLEGGGMSPALAALLMGVVLHNIPEGMAIALPLYTSGMNRWKAGLAAACTGIPTIVGAVIGYSVGGAGPLAVAAALSFAAGTLLYVVFGEVLPQSINLYCSRKTAFAAIAGLAAGLLIIGIHAH